MSFRKSRKLVLDMLWAYYIRLLSEQMRVVSSGPLPADVNARK